MSGMAAVKELHERANTEYDRGNIPGAAELWEEALQIAQSDPSVTRQAVGAVLGGLGECFNRLAKCDKAIDHYRKHLVNIRVLARRRPNLRLLEVSYAEAVGNPRETALRISRFLSRTLDIDEMAGIIDSKLYRNRAN